MKRLFDFILSFTGLILLSPFLLFISILIKITNNGSIFFVQERVGKNGSLFKMIKFRTMYTDHNDNNTISVKGDSRITKLGFFLRKYKIDELPELINVLFGDMSFVGPRPDVKGYADKLKGDHRKILKLRPGITGPASIKFINEELLLSKQENPKYYNDNVIYPEKVRINLDYFYNNSIWIDFKIIFATIFRISN
ncbi:MAG: sugar transferase [Flavobacteriales bacterium]|jgi:lipopolysaccharide/colanic/teichoic acid biosynthesis glycosyltransferase|nr:sugar transferase [Flavobacteriales bacterium]MDC3390443.1 sugar transferase [Flavobacteriales bacterium]